MRAGVRDQAGFTIIEVVVAILLLGISTAALATLFATGNNSALASNLQTQLLSVADQQIQALRSDVKVDGFSNLALASTPTPATLSSTNPTNPDAFAETASGCGTSGLALLIENNYNNTAEGTLGDLDTYSGCPGGSEPLIVSTSGLTKGFVAPAVTGVTVGTGTATLYTFVTQTDAGCSSTLTAADGGTCSGDARRVTVAVVPTSIAGGSDSFALQAPVWISTLFTNPVPSNQANTSIGIAAGVNLG